MAIVQDEISLVKVKNGKDGIAGKDTYIYKAYSLSADGTDRFTTEYPNENLILGSNSLIANSNYNIADYKLTHKNLKNGELISITIYGDLGSDRDTFRAYNTFGAGDYFLGSFNKIDDGIYRLDRVWIENNNNDILRIFQYPNSATSTSEIKKIKLENSNHSTIYTPSPQDDYENAYPKYDGYYSSHNPVQSTNPSDYTWSVIRGENGKDGITPKDVISGYLSNESIIVPATPTGAVTDYSKALGDFVVFKGQIKLVNGVTYSKVSEVNMTSTINSAGRYVVTALSADTGTATYRATYAGVTVDKILIVVKNKQGPSGANGAKGDKGDSGKDGIAGKDGVGVKSTTIVYGISDSESTQPTTWTSSVPSLVKGKYLWTKTVWEYTDNTNETGYVKTYIAKDGNNGNDGIAGKDGVGIKNTTFKYGISISGTTKPSNWSTNIPTVPEGQFLWTETTWTYTDNTNEKGYSVAKQGAKGDPTGITVSPTVPTDKYINMLWQNTGSNNGYLTGTVYQWNGAKWNIFIFSAENIVANSLSAISANLGNVTAGNIKGATIEGTNIIGSTVETRASKAYPDLGAILYWSKLTDSLRISGSSGQNRPTYETTYQLDGMSGFGSGPTGTGKDSEWYFGLNGLSYKSGGVTGIGKVSYDFTSRGFNIDTGNFKVNDGELSTNGPTRLSPASGFSVYSTSDDNLPQARRFGKTVTLSGAFTNNSNLAKGWSGVIGRLPGWATPSIVHRVLCQGSGSNTFYLQVKPNGELFLERYGTNDNVAFNSDAWLTINTTYLV